MSTPAETSDNSGVDRSFPPAVPPRELAAARFAVAAGIVGLVLAVVVRGETPNTFALGFAWTAGLVVAAVVRNRYRVGGWIAVAAVGWFAAAVVEMLLESPPGPVQWFFMAVVVVAGLRFVVGFRGDIGIAEVAGGIGLGIGAGALDPATASIALLVLTGVLALVTVPLLFRPLFENLVELALFPGYAIRGVGPGVVAFPTRGPVLVIANHAAYIDPAFLAKDIPRPLTAMMTQNFFDKPILRQLMTYVYDTIRVREVAVRKEAPELGEAVAALNAGKCVVIFPEGYLRRTEAVPLRRFGRGVWQILRDRPETLVVACWIEGGWGSYFSFKDGPPMVNKRWRFRQPIRVGMSVPFTVPAEILADHLATRLYLMGRVNAARAHVGLDLLPEQALPNRGEE